MKNLYVYKKLAALSLVPTTLVFSGCCSNNNDNLSIKIDKTSYEKTMDKSSNLSGLPYLTQENKNTKEYEYILKHGDDDIKLLYLNKERTYTSEIIKGITDSNTKAMSAEFFANNMNFIMPDCYKWISNRFNTDFCEFTIKIKEFNSNILGCRYLLYETEVRFKKIPSDVPQYVLVDGGKTRDKAIQKGDYIYSSYLYAKKLNLDFGEFLLPIAFEQTGMGSECKNVQRYRDVISNSQTIEYTLVPLSETDFIKDSIELDGEDELQVYFKTYKEKN